MKHTLIIIFSLFLWSCPISAQQEIIFTKYIYHALYFNPAYAGCHGFGQGTAMIQYRNQWMGLEGSPATLMGSVEHSLANDRVGLGLTLGRESIGIDARTDMSANFAYRIPISKGNLAGGIRVGFSHYISDFTKLQNVQIGDPLHESNNNQFSIFSSGFGLYYNEQRFFIGLTMPAVAALSNKDKSSFKARHLYFHTGGMMGPESNLINVEPSLLVSYQKAAPIQYTLGLNVWYNRQFAIGAHLRSGDAFALSTEMFLMDRLRMSLSYDFTISDIRNYESGSLEVMVAYHLYKAPKIKKIKHIRYGGRF